MLCVIMEHYDKEAVFAVAELLKYFYCGNTVH